MDVLLAAVVVQTVTGIAALVVSKSPRAATAFGCGGAVTGCLLGLAPTLRVLGGAAPESLRFAVDAAHGNFVAEVDPLSAFFLLPVLGLSALAAVYGAGYLFAYRHQKSLGSAWFFFNVFVAGMVVVLVARTVILFLIAWEVMSVAAFCLVTFEHEKAEVRRAGWIYLIATHIGAAFLVFALLLLGRSSGSLEFDAFATPSVRGAGAAATVFLLALFGFGAKAGFVPFHVWLPEAHPAAPSHVSALMSGVMIKMGLYGILRVLTFLGPPQAWWGPALAALGLLTALVGVALALQQRDIKRVLAYSSIENMGLIALGLGVGLWGAAAGLPAVAALGSAAALFHIWNHCLMKGLMFLAAGSVLHATGTKDMEKLGGLMKRMPWTATALTTGAVAMAALPPLNGFVGKWLLYLGLMRGGLAANDGRGLTALLCVGLLALIGGGAAIAFVRLTGIVLTGAPRSEAARHAHEASVWLVGPMAVLVLLCVTAALAPGQVVGWMAGPLEQVPGVEAWRALTEVQAEAPLEVLGVVNAWILVVAAASAAVATMLLRRGGQVEHATWGCGYVLPSPRMQYTGRSFAEMTAEHLLPRSLRPRTVRHRPHGLFPSKSDFGSECPDPVTKRIYEPLFERWAERFARLRILQQGKVHVYLVYIVVTVVLALAWVSMRTWWVAE
jgi:formate hydrogenlyase subunit 3/multisubunit Na+/H+ antiporter MnhD subunit